MSEIKVEPIIRVLAQMLEEAPENLNSSYQLDTNGFWDSFAQINVIRAIDSHYQLKVETQTLMKCSSVGDILKLIEKQ